MKLWDAAELSALNLRKNPVRTLLTILGLSVGIAAILTVWTLGNAGQAQVTAEIARLGVDKVWITAREDSPRTLNAADSQQLTAATGAEASAGAATLGAVWLGEAAAYDGEGRGTRDEAAAYDGEDWDARGEAPNFARVEAHSREDFDEELDWDDNAPRDSAFDGVNSCAASLRTPRRADRGDGAPYSCGPSSARGASDDSDRAFSVHPDLRSRDTRAEASPLPGITRDAAPRGDARFSAEPSISREARRSHTSAEPSISREAQCSHTSAPRGGTKRSAQPRVREGVRREPEPPDDLFMDDL